jgi:C-terminal processing protease CtpA/Prc
MYFYKTAILFICLIFCTDISAKWRAIYNEINVETIYYDIFDDPIFKDYPIFPLNKLVVPTGVGLCVTKYEKINKQNILDSLNLEEKEYHFFDKTFSPLALKNTTIVKHAIYQRNVASYDISILTSDGRWHKRTFDCSFEGYQIPKELSLSNWVRGNDIIVAGVLIMVKPNNQNEKITFVVSEFNIIDQIVVEKECQHPFLDKLFDKVGNCDTILMGNGLLYSDEELPLLCTEETYMMQRMSNYFSFKTDSNDSEIDLFKKIIHLAIEDYPFYQERNLTQQTIKNKFMEFCSIHSDSMSVQDFSNSLSAFIRNEFMDTHFFVEPPKGVGTTTISGPVRLYEIAGKILVAAILDTLYRNIPLGAEVIAINKIPVNKIIDSLSVSQLGQPERKRMRAVATMLHKNSDDSAKITYMAIGKTDSSIVRYNRKINISPQFRPAHCLFEFVDSIAYFNINQMDSYVFLRFINHIEQIKNAKGLILDLRGNSGGSSSEGEKLFSLFINRPAVYHHVIPLNRPNRLESRMIRPNKDIHFPSNYPVVILGDENTACASENFIQAMKQLPQCYFLSYSTTYGALQARYGISFPSGTFFSLDCLSPKTYTYEVGIVENVGISPNVWVQPTKVEDLAPYDDLLKTVSKKIINSNFY